MVTAFQYLNVSHKGLRGKVLAVASRRSSFLATPCMDDSGCFAAKYIKAKLVNLLRARLRSKNFHQRSMNWNRIMAATEGRQLSSIRATRSLSKPRAVKNRMAFTITPKVIAHDLQAPNRTPYH